MRLQCRRANAVLGYWQDGFKEEVPTRDFKGQGWGVDPTLKNFASLDITKENCVMWLSEHSYVGSDNKTKTLVCKDCRPPTTGKPINCQRCRCKLNDRKCSLSCGCRDTVAGALRSMMATRATAAAAAAEAAAAEAAAAAAAKRAAAEAAAAAAAEGAAAEAAAAAAEAAPAAVAEDHPDASEENAPVAQKEVDFPEDHPDRIPDWTSDASGTSDLESDVSYDGGSDDGEWDMSLEDGPDAAEWIPGDD